MKTHHHPGFKVALLAFALLMHGAAPAQDSYTPKPPADDALYQAFGARPGLVKLMDDFVPRLVADERLKTFFVDVDLKQLKEKLVTQVCQVSGGPCRREGPGMKTAHDGMDIRKHDFNALVEVLQLSMDAQGIPFGTQNRLLAQLAPMHRDIVNTP
jgi:hemoglobin